VNFKSHQVYVFSTPTDMRKSYNGLHGLVRDEFDVLSGALFLFISHDRKRAKCLFWDGTGLNIFMKRLEQGRFADIFTRKEVSFNELKLFFEGSREVVKRLSPEDLSDKFSS